MTEPMLGYFIYQPLIKHLISIVVLSIMLNSLDFTTMKKEGIRVFGDEALCGSDRISFMFSERQHWEQN